MTGQNSAAAVMAYMEQVLRECTARQCFRVLIEEKLEGPRLGTLQVFGLAARGSERFLGALKAMAYVDVNAQGDLMRFAENVAVNRAIPVRVFTSVLAAERWLTDARSPGAGKAADTPEA